MQRLHSLFDERFLPPVFSPYLNQIESTSSYICFSLDVYYMSSFAHKRVCQSFRREVIFGQNKSFSSFFRISKINNYPPQGVETTRPVFKVSKKKRPT